MHYKHVLRLDESDNNSIPLTWHPHFLVFHSFVGFNDNRPRASWKLSPPTGLDEREGEWEHKREESSLKIKNKQLSDYLDKYNYM